MAATRAYIPEAEKKITFDRYHIMRLVVDAVDKVRKQEHRALMKEGDFVYPVGSENRTGARDLFLVPACPG
ncbi:MAG: transposase [Thermodesulfobacteriota bacterium]|nr:transposase [Thermodesulfobacteriota bacterium]